MSTPHSSRSRAPYRVKSALARLGPAYRWARRMRALGRYAARRPHDPDFAAFRQSSLTRDHAAAVLERLQAEGVSPSRLRLQPARDD